MTTAAGMFGICAECDWHRDNPDGPPPHDHELEVAAAHIEDAHDYSLRGVTMDFELYALVHLHKQLHAQGGHVRGYR